MEEWYDDLEPDQQELLAKGKAQIRARLHNSTLETQAVRALAQAALLRKETAEESEQDETHFVQDHEEPGISRLSKQQDDLFISAELTAVQAAEWPSNYRSSNPSNSSSSSSSSSAVQLQLCSRQGVYAHISASSHRSLLLRMFFTSCYPTQPIAADIESQTLHPGLLEKLRAAVLNRCQQLAKQGEQQVLPAMQLVVSFLQGNRLAAAYQEIKQVQQLCHDSGSKVLAAKEKQGTIQLRLQSEAYHMQVLLRLHSNYPAEPLEVTIQDTNIPQDMVLAFATAAMGLAKQLAEPPPQCTRQSVGRAGAGTSNKPLSKRAAAQTLHSSQRAAEISAASAAAAAARAAAVAAARQAFVAQPAVYEVVQLLLVRCLQPVASGQCGVCKKRLLPADPANLPKVPQRLRVLRLDCGHLYHHRCVEGYLAVPPFEGKGCHTCGQPISHWQLVTNPKVLQGRWAAQQARLREISEVADFLSV